MLMKRTLCENECNNVVLKNGRLWHITRRYGFFRALEEEASEINISNLYFSSWSRGAAGLSVAYLRIKGKKIHRKRTLSRLRNWLTTLMKDLPR